MMLVIQRMADGTGDVRGIGRDSRALTTEVTPGAFAKRLELSVRGL
jgi:hypothetical protein